MGLKRRSCKLAGKPVNVVQDVIKTVPLVQCSTSGARIVTISSLRSELKRIPGDQRRKELGDIDTLTKEKINAHLFLFSFWSMTFLGLVEAFEYDGESSPKCFFSRMRSVSTTSLLGSFALDIAFGIGGLPEVLLLNWILKPTMGLPEDIISWGALDTTLSSSFLQLRKQQFHVSKNCLRLACTRLEVVAGELSKSCHGRQQKQNCFWIGERCIVHFKLHAACFLIYQCN